MTADLRLRWRVTLNHDEAHDAPDLGLSNASWSFISSKL